MGLQDEVDYRLNDIKNSQNSNKISTIIYSQKVKFKPRQQQNVVT